MGRVPSWASELSYLYWYLRMTRFPAAKQRYYRRIRKEKTRLIAAGVCPFLVHAVCKRLANPRSERAEERLRRVLEAQVA